jgi:hypothetical protein
VFWNERPQCLWAFGDCAWRTCDTFSRYFRVCCFDVNMGHSASWNVEPAANIQCSIMVCRELRLEMGWVVQNWIDLCWFRRSSEYFANIVGRSFLICLSRVLRSVFTVLDFTRTSNPKNVWRVMLGINFCLYHPPWHLKATGLCHGCVPIDWRAGVSHSKSLMLCLNILGISFGDFRVARRWEILWNWECWAAELVAGIRFPMNFVSKKLGL